MRKLVFGCAGLLLLTQATAALAASDIAPTPRRMPREPVSRQELALRNKNVMPPSRTVTGVAHVLDSERLKIGDVEMRLFGVVPPQLSAPFGPQARAVLDAVAATGDSTCNIHDRDREGRFLATCQGQNKADFAMELLRRGLAVTARGSLGSSPLAAPYVAAEQAAQGHKLGLWSVIQPAAASAASVKEAVQRNEAAVAAEKAEADKKTEAAPTAEAIDKAVKADNVLKIPPVMMEIPPLSPEVHVAVPQTSLLERYQLLASGLLAVLASLGVIGAVALRHRWEKRDDLRSIAAALRGELMAARAVCQTRLGMMERSGESTIAWPRIRVLVFQAYVGRLGRLGAELSRQIASIYGLASDYAAYYNTSGASEPVSKQQALQTLVQHIGEVLPRLEQIEKPPRPLSLKVAPPHRRLSAPAAEQQDVPMLATLESEESEEPEEWNPVTVKTEAAPVDEKPAEEVKAEEIKEASSQASAEKKDEAVKEEAKAAKPEAPVNPTTENPSAAIVAAATAALAEVIAEPEVKAAEPTLSEKPSAESPAPLWGVIRKFATERKERPAKKNVMEDLIPDYAAMIEEDIDLSIYLNDDDLADEGETVFEKSRAKA